MFFSGMDDDSSDYSAGIFILSENMETMDGYNT